MYSENTLLLGGLVALTGVIVGSFLNALVWRIHKKLPIGGKERSQCTSCKHILAWRDLIPVISWLLLKGKCRYCNKNISAQYPIVELLNALVWVTSFLLIAPTSTLEYVLFALWLFASSILIALAVYDARWFLLPDKLVVAFTAVSFIYALNNSLAAKNTFELMNPLLGVVVVAGFFYLLFAVSEGKWIGGGDVKLGVGMGLLLGLDKGLLAVFIGALFGSIFGIIGIALFKKDRKSMIPFGPFLITGTVISFLLGEAIIDWYLGLII